MSESIVSQRDARDVVTLTLNRREKHNAFDAALISSLTETLRGLDRQDTVRAVILTGSGDSFSSGADIDWMRSMANHSEQENFQDALRLAELMAELYRLRHPTIARVNGHAFGGAVGLVACCDIAIASADARFGFTEVRLGIVPAVISSYVIAAVGERQARRLFMSGEIVNARRARRIGLVHEIAKAGKLDAVIDEQVRMLLRGGPAAQRACKALVARVASSGDPAGEDLRRHTAELIAHIRVSPEGQEGLGAFLDKRTPDWHR